MHLLIASFLAGILSVLAPCVISILPVILGKTVSDTNSSKPRRRAWIIIFSLLISVFIFSLALKATTLFIAVPQMYLQALSGGIILFFGFITLFPQIWEKVSIRLKLQQNAQKGSAKAFKKQGISGDILLGASLGPIFSACSPTYALIVATIIPVSFARGLLYLIVFLAGLGSVLLLISTLGQSFVSKIGWSINPNGWFKRTLGILFILVGLTILTGFDKKIETFFVQNGLFDWQVNLESKIQQ